MASWPATCWSPPYGLAPVIKSGVFGNEIMYCPTISLTVASHATKPAGKIRGRPITSCNCTGVEEINVLLGSSPGNISGLLKSSHRNVLKLRVSVIPRPQIHYKFLPSGFGNRVPRHRHDTWGTGSTRNAAPPGLRARIENCPLLCRSRFWWRPDGGLYHGRTGLETIFVPGCKLFAIDHPANIGMGLKMAVSEVRVATLSVVEPSVKVTPPISQAGASNPEITLKTDEFSAGRGVRQTFIDLHPIHRLHLAVSVLFQPVLIRSPSTFAFCHGWSVRFQSVCSLRSNPGDP